MFLAAQVSIYPLRQPRLSPAIDKALGIFEQRGLEVTPGAMSSVVSGDDEALFAATKEVLQQASEQGEVVLIITLSNACPVPSQS
ncbi:hypothetical protein ES705_49079 [subsurface metagenome]